MKKLAYLALAVVAAGAVFAQKNVVDPLVKDALLASLNSERRAEAEYKAAIAKYGSLAPYTNVVEAEKQHQATVLKLMNLYGVAAPANPWVNFDFDLPETYAEGCLMAMDEELADAAWYGQTAAQLKAANVAKVFKQLQYVNVERHAVAFKRASEGNCLAGTGNVANCGQGAGNCMRSQNRRGQGNGICDGTGKGQGQGRGNKAGICDGTGKGQGQGRGRGNGRG
jgi:hypothetical protein